jgi:hypothetical protein
MDGADGDDGGYVYNDEDDDEHNDAFVDNSDFFGNLAGIQPHPKDGSWFPDGSSGNGFMLWEPRHFPRLQWGPKHSSDRMRDAIYIVAHHWLGAHPEGIEQDFSCMAPWVGRGELKLHQKLYYFFIGPVCFGT